jgi:hypothetical protein
VSKPRKKWVRDMRAAAAKDKPPAAGRETRTPFEVMYYKGQLDRDPRMNSILHSAGTRYFSDWRQSGMEPISAMAYDRVGGGSGGAPGFMPVTERQMIYRQSWRNARASMQPRHAAVVDPIVLEGRTSADMRAETGYKARQYASVAVMERLASGLMSLAIHYKIGAA